jgi:hypothetical protein
MTRRAKFILDEADRLGIKVGTYGENLDYITPRGLPRATAMSFSRALYEHREEVIAAIMAESSHE